jgi:predicted metal-dependent hydrolase
MSFSSYLVFAVVFFQIFRLPKEKRDEVILHELLHLKYPNHGKMFTTLLKTYVEKMNG